MQPLHDYDATLKKILSRAGSLLLRRLTGSDSIEWVNIELHGRGSLRVDLLGRTPDGRLIHIELQSRNEKFFYVRMGEYGFAIARQYGQYPEQFVLYVGQEPLRMENEIHLPQFPFRFGMIDIRDLDTLALLKSPNPSDNVIAILTRDGGNKEVIRQVLAKIARAKGSQRKEALAELMAIAGLRKLGNVIGREVKQMPILEDFMDHDFLGPKLRKAHAEGLEQGLEKGLEQGLEQGLEKGQLGLLLKLAERRFGQLPSTVRKRLEALKPLQLERAGLRLLDARRVEDLLPR